MFLLCVSGGWSMLRRMDVRRWEQGRLLAVSGCRGISAIECSGTPEGYKVREDRPRREENKLVFILRPFRTTEETAR